MNEPAGAEEPPRSVWRRTLPWAFAVFALAGSIYYAQRSGVNWSVLLSVGPFEIGSLLLLMALNLGLNAVVNRAALAALCARLSLIEASALSASGAWLNKVLPLQSGAVGRAVYLKRRHNVAYSRFFGIQVAIFTFRILMAGILGSAMWGILRETGLELSPLLLGLCIVLVVGMAGALLLPIPDWGPTHRISRLIASAVEGWSVLKRPQLAVKVGCLEAVKLVLTGVRLWIALGALGQDIGLPAALFAGVLVAMSQVVRLTPGNLGIREAVTGALAVSVQSGFGAGVIASGLLRVLSFLLAMVLGPPSSSWLSSRVISGPEKESPPA